MPRSPNLYKAPYILYTKNAPSRIGGGAFDACSDEGTTDTFIFREGVSLPCLEPPPNILAADICKLMQKNPKEYNIVFQTQFSQEELLKWDIVPATELKPLVKKPVVDLLEAMCPDDFQAFPAKVRYNIPVDKKTKRFIVNDDYWKSPICHDYFLLNITNQMDILDHKLAYIEKAGPHSFYAQNIIFPEGTTLAPHHIARIMYESLTVVVSQELAKAMKKAGFRGPDFQPWMKWFHTSESSAREFNGWKGQCPCPTCEAKREEEKAQTPPKKGWFW